jgi:peptidoglycan/LPS O-acetylase OafA/YrhL
MAVVAYHIPTIGNGQWGVDLFFVISGFIMCYVTERSGERFLQKRIVRVVPLYWLGTVAIFGVGLASPSLLSSTSPDAFALIRSLLFIPFEKGNGVFPLLYLGWSLNYEMFFYGLFALAMLIDHRRRALWTGAAITLCVVAGMFIDRSMTVAWFFTRPIMLEFLLGMGVYTVIQRIRSHGSLLRSRSATVALSVVALAAVSVVIMWDVASNDTVRPFVWGILSSVIVLSTILALHSARIPRWLILIGDASYSLYLFHPYLIQGIVKTTSWFTSGVAVQIAASVGTLAACCGIAILVFRLVELPMTTFLRKRFIERTAG